MVQDVQRLPGDPLGPNCQHDIGEDCMNCIVCGRCTETLNGNDVCISCVGKDANED